MNYLKNIYVLSLTVCVLLLSTAAYAITMENALKSSLVNNLEIKLEKNNSLAAKENVNQSISSYFPSIILQGSISESEVTNIKSQTGELSSGYNLEPSSASITISQNIFNGFANLLSTIPSGGRFISLGNLLAIILILFIVQNYRMSKNFERI